MTTDLVAPARDLRDVVARHPWFVAWLSLLPLLVMRAGTLAESDTFWQIRAGLLTMTDRALPTVDTFSWTAQGDPWTLNSWGFNVVLAAVYQIGGLAGVALVSAAVVGGALWLVLMLARRSGAHPLVAALILQMACFVLIGFFSARPQIVDYVAVLLLVVLLDNLLRGRGSDASTVAWTGVLMVVWVNLHAAATLGVAIVGAVMGLAFAMRAARAIPLCAAFGAAVVGVLLNPYGFDVVAQSFHVAGASTSVITEWKPLDFGDPTQLVPLLLAVLALLVAVRRRDIVNAGALAILSVGAVGAVRLLPLMVLVSVPVLASAASNPSVVRYIASRRVMLAQGAVVVVGIFTMMAVPSLTHIGQPAPGLYSASLVDAIPQDCRLFNDYTSGGFVILQRPDVLVSVDSRNDMYGEARVRASYMALSQLPGDEIAGADCAMVPNASPLARQLAESNEWRPVKADRVSTLFVRA